MINTLQQILATLSSGAEVTITKDFFKRYGIVVTTGAVRTLGRYVAVNLSMFNLVPQSRLGRHGIYSHKTSDNLAHYEIA